MSFHQVLPGYFEAAGIRVRRGRGFEETDHADAPPVAIVSQSFARRYLAGREPLGARFKFGPADGEGVRRTIVGIVEDVRQQSPAEGPDPELYLAFNQVPRTGIFYVIRSALPPDAILPALRAAVREADPSLPVESTGPLEDRVAGALLEPRFYTGLLSGFAAVALLLAAVGVYGVMTLMVDQRKEGSLIGGGASARRRNGPALSAHRASG